VNTDPDIIRADDPILVTGASGFMGPRLVKCLISHGYRNLRCLARPASDPERLAAVLRNCNGDAQIEVMRGNLLSRDDCAAATRGVAVIYHLAAGRGEKAFADAYMNSVVTTRNLVEAGLNHRCLRRLVNVSSFSVYSNRHKPRRCLLDESCPVEAHPERRGDAYSFAKLKQDELVEDYGRRCGLPHVIVRPGVVYGPGNENIHGRVGIGTFGIFLHLGGGNTIPLTYVDNCVEAIALAGMRRGVEGEVFNVVDDDLPTSRKFLRLYKRNVRRFRSIYLPRAMSYGLCYLWEKYSRWSEGQLPPTYSRAAWHVFWKKTRYSNEKIKARLGWKQPVATAEGLKRHFESCRARVSHA
jgi:nucleoside-diphosphate-sugar epimerase